MPRKKPRAAAAPGTTGTPEATTGPGAGEIEALRARALELERRIAELERAGEASARRALEARSVLEVGRAILASRDLDAVLELVVKRAAHLLRTPRAGLAVLEGEGHDAVVRFVARHGMSDRFPERMRPRHPRDGTTPAAITERRPVWSADLLEDTAFQLTPETRAAIGAEGYRAVLSVPLLAAGRVLGALVVYRDAPGPFSPDEVDLLQSFAAQAAIALQHAGAYEEAEARRRAAESLAELGRLVSQSLNPEEVGQRVADSVRTLLRAEASTLYRLDDASGDLVTLATSGDMGPGLGRSVVLPRGTGVSGLAVRERRPVVSANALTDPRITLTPEFRDGAEQAPFRAVLALPLTVQERVIGALAVADRAGRAFGEEEIRLVQAFADQAALAVDNARLYQEAQRRVRELATVQRVAQAINSTLRLDEVFRTVVTRISEAFAYQMVSIYLASAEGLLLQASVGYAQVIPSIPWGRGITGRVARTGRGELVRDAAGDPDFLFAVPGIRQGITVPLKARDGTVLGTLGAESTGDPPLTESDLALLTLLADQVSVAVVNARLYAETTRRRQEAEELARVGRTLTESLDLTAVVQRIVDGVLPLFKVRSSGLSVLQADGSLVTIAFGGRAAEVFQVGHVMPPGVGVMGRVLAEGRPVWSRDRFHDPDVVLTDELRERLAISGNRSMLAVPLRLKGEPRGVLSIADPEPRDFSEAEVALLQAFADQAAIALENSRLYGELQGALRTAEESQQRVAQGERLRALGELASGVAHDFNNGLAVILGRAQLLLRQADDPDTRRQAAVIEQTAMDGARTVRRIQEFARMRRARPLQPTSLNQVVQEVVEVTRSRWRDQAQVQGLTYDVRIEAGTVPPVAGDPAELREALTNVVFNALDAMPQGGRLTFETRLEGDRVVCRATDTGVGMTEEVRKRVFDPFFTTKGERGSGLGLSLVYGIVRRHGGEVEVRSQPGQGSTFILRFPVEPPPAPGPPAVEPARARPGARILLIDDEPAVLDTLKDLLAGEGHAVVACADGSSGLERFDTEPFDLVLTDLGMPRLSGWDVAKAVKSRSPRTPVALVTGWGDQIDPAEARAKGVDYLLPKPCQIGEVAAVVAQALARKETAPP